MGATIERLVGRKTPQSHIPCEWYDSECSIPLLVRSFHRFGGRSYQILTHLIQTEVTQQSRIRHKEDFIIAFSPVIAEATAIAYKGAPSELQGKLRRVIDVWKDRNIFEAPIQEAIETRLAGKYP